MQSENEQEAVMMEREAEEQAQAEYEAQCAAEAEAEMDAEAMAVADQEQQRQNRQLVAVLAENQVEPELAKQITTGLTPFFEQARVLAAQAMSIKVISEDQVELMKQARERRLALKKIRTETENARKAMKEGITRAGKAVDGAANIIKFLVQPAEEHLEAQEKYVERLREERLAALSEKRTAELQAYEVDCQFFNLRDMNEGHYQRLLSSSKDAYATKKEVERKAEEERVAAEEAKAEQEAKMREENERLRREAEAREKERQEQEAKLEAERQANEAKLKAAAEAREKAEAELKAKQEAEEQAKAREEQRKKDEELERLRAEKQARLAPDKDKLIKFAATLDEIELPDVKNPEAQALIKRVADYLASLKVKLIEEAEKL